MLIADWGGVVSPRGETMARQMKILAKSHLAMREGLLGGRRYIGGGDVNYPTNTFTYSYPYPHNRVWRIKRGDSL